MDKFTGGKYSELELKTSMGGKYSEVGNIQGGKYSWSGNIQVLEIIRTLTQGLGSRTQIRKEKVENM